ncbi:hypothetical protein MYP_4065 [Sporocytophaga myxococcoides]|uniref:Uncharacterized protein n=1 Tax=Sporocytophaga myxococcoides TaxID=153721 RepID=A0A098LIR6_9BACT|nr:hypothetical protein MYP_4065 [Sporocytophaga myxococcoides]
MKTFTDSIALWVSQWETRIFQEMLPFPDQSQNLVNFTFNNTFHKFSFTYFKKF